MLTNHAELLWRELDWNLLDLPVGRHDRLDDLDASLRRLHLLTDHLGRLQLDHLRLHHARRRGAGSALLDNLLTLKE